MSCLQQVDPSTRDMFQEAGPEDTFILARLMQALQEAGASVGTDDIIKGVSYGVAGVSGLSASSVSAVSNINALAGNCCWHRRSALHRLFYFQDHLARGVQPVIRKCC